jgi:hypothetical protein
MLVGVVIGRASDRYELTPKALAVYAVIGALILTARWSVVRHRERKDLEQKA